MATSLMSQAEEIAKKNTITPVTQQFDESKGVASRVNQLTTQGTPLMQTAATRASQSAAARGLTNSSLAAQAGEQAVIETATPIANADANLYSQQSLANQSAENAARTNNAGNAIGLAGNAMGLENSNEQQTRQLGESGRQFDISAGQNAENLKLSREQLAEQTRQANESMGLQRQQLTQQQTQFEASQAQQKVLAQMDSDSRMALAKLEAANKSDVQGSQNISNAWGSMMQGITSIQTNPELDQSTKATLIQQQMDQFGAFSNFWKKMNGNTDVSDLLNFSTAAVPGGKAAAPPPAAAPAPAPAPAYNGGGFVGGYRGGGFPVSNTADGL